MRTAAFLLAGLLLLPVQYARSQRVTVIPEDVLGALGAIADTATVEHMRCGFYDEVGDTLLVLSRVVSPVVIATSADSMAVAKCPPGTDLVWHNHRVLDPTHRAEWYCMLSPADVAVVLRNVPRLYMISVRSDIRCWWTAHQVAAAIEGHLWPVPGQFTMGQRP